MEDDLGGHQAYLDEQNTVAFPGGKDGKEEDDDDELRLSDKTAELTYSGYFDGDDDAYFGGEFVEGSYEENLRFSARWVGQDLRPK